jgi:organic hydroperoxide reductase OsmC/OhrA
MIHYPLQFSVKVNSSQGIQSVWNAQVPGQDQLKVAIPPEFEGPGGGFSPEDFFILATANCFVATFKVMAEKSKIVFDAIELNGVSTVDRDESGRPWIKALAFDVIVKGAADRERMDRILQKASQSCIILHSVKSEITFQFTIQ